MFPRGYAYLQCLTTIVCDGHGVADNMRFWVEESAIVTLYACRGAAKLHVGGRRRSIFCPCQGSIGVCQVNENTVADQTTGKLQVAMVARRYSRVEGLIVPQRQVFHTIVVCRGGKYNGSRHIACVGCAAEHDDVPGTSGGAGH